MTFKPAVDLLRQGVKPGLLTGAPSPTIQPFEQKKHWYDVFDPLLWLLEKINRPQQALFEAIHRAQKDDSFWRGLGEGFWQGSDVRAVTIMDEMGLKGQAGSADWLDVVAGAAEIFLDPVNLVSFGAGKIGALGKTGRIAGALGLDAAALTNTADNITQATRILKQMEATGGAAGDAADLSRAIARLGGTPVENMLPHIIDRAEQLLVPGVGSTFARVGIGKYRYAIPGSNVVLEATQLPKAGRWLRRSRLGKVFSTAAETPEAALDKASSQIAVDYAQSEAARLNRLWQVAVGAMKPGKFAADSPALKGVREIMEASQKTEHKLGFADAAKEYIFKVDEAANPGAMLEGAPDELVDVYNLNHFYGEILPALEGEAHIRIQPFVGPSPIDVLEAGVGKELAYKYTKRLLYKPMVDYKQKVDAFWGKMIQGRIYQGWKFTTYGAYQKGRTVLESGEYMNRLMREVGDVIHTEYKAGELGKLLDKGSHNGLIFNSTESYAYFKEGGIKNITDIPRKGIKEGLITESEAHHLTDKMGIPKETNPFTPGVAPMGELPPVYKMLKSEMIAELKEAGLAVPEGASKADLQKMLRDHRYPVGKEPDNLFNQFSYDVRKAMTGMGKEIRDEDIKVGIRTLAKRAREAGEHPQEFITDWLLDNIWARGAAEVRRDMVRFERLAENAKKIQVALGLGDEPVRLHKMFENSYEIKKFKSFYSTDWGMAMAHRVGEDYLNRTTTAILDRIMLDPKWARQAVKFTKEEKGIAQALKDAGVDLMKDGTPVDEVLAKQSIVERIPGEIYENLDEWGELAGPSIPEGWGTLELPDGMAVGMTDDFRNKIEKHVFSPEIREAFQQGLALIHNHDEATGVYSAIRQSMAWLRASTILPFAGYHIANIFGNKWARYIGGTIDVYNDLLTRKLFLKARDPKQLNDVLFKIGDKEWTVNKLITEAGRGRVTGGGKLTHEIMASAYGTTEDVVAGKVALWKKFSPVHREQFGGDLATILEDHDRVAHFIGRLRAGDEMEQAIRSVDVHLFRYDDLSQIEKGTKQGLGVRDVTFFYTWYRKNLGLTLQKVWEYPGRMSQPVKIRNLLEGAYGKAESPFAVPQYLVDRFHLYLGKDEETGESMVLDPEKYLPPLSAGKFLSNPTSEIFSALGPGIRMFAELALGKEEFTGREIGGIPGEKAHMFGMPMSPKTAYTLRNLRILNTINRTLWPAVEEEGYRPYIRAGEAPLGARTGKELFGAFKREYVGIKKQKVKPQKNRYYKAMSPSTGIIETLDKITSKLAGKLTAEDREGYIIARRDLLWERAEVLREMIEDGTDPFTGKPMDWQPPMPDPGERAPHSMRDVYTEMHSTLRSLYFGEPALPGILLVEPKSRLSPEENEQAYGTMVRLKLDMLDKDAAWAIEHKSKKTMYNRVFDPIRDIIRRPKFWERRGDQPGRDEHIYDYPYDYRRSLVDLFWQYLMTGLQTGVIPTKSRKQITNNFNEDYEVDYS